MELESTDKTAMVYETLKNIKIAINRLEERNVQVHSANDFLLSPWGMEKLDAACMVIIALGESVKTLDKQTDKKLLPTYPSIPWKNVKGLRDIIAHHYFDVDASQILWIINNEISPLKQAIQYFIKVLGQ